MQRARGLTSPRPSPPGTRQAASSAWPTSLFSTTTKRKNSSVLKAKSPALAGLCFCPRLLIAYRLETERHSATDRARRLHQIQCLPVTAYDRNIPFREQVSHVHQQLHVF